MIEGLILIALLVWLFRWLGRSAYQPPQHVVLEIVLRSQPEDETIRRDPPPKRERDPRGDNIVQLFPKAKS
jgi:hypothetical protein